MAGAEGASSQLDRAAVEEALSGHTVDQLKETAVRLSRSISGLEEVLADMEVEKKQLIAEGEDLNNTISLIMQEMQKLKIGANNTIEPHLQEGALDFINRLWEKHRPRDTAYQTSEHVGEIRKPVPGEENQRPQQVRQAVQEASQQVVKTAEKLQGAIGPWWARTQGFLAEKQSELVASMAARAAAQQQAAAPAKEEKKKSKRAKENDASAAGYPNGAGLGEIPIPPTASSRPAAAEASSAAAAPEEKKEDTPSAAADEEKSAPPAATTATDSSNPPKTTTTAPSSDDGTGNSNEDSTLVIKAELTLDDGTVKTLLVRAEDRTKEVAQRFVQENSLKAWFQEPLNKWLKKVENDTDTFPAMVQGDLLEIKKQFSKAPKP